MKRKLLVTILGFCAAITIQAQQLESILASYNNKKVAQEKIHVHFDNSVYTAGQTVWFKAYILKGQEPSDLSKNMYIDWSDEDGKLIRRTISPILNGYTLGDFTVPQKYTGTRIQVTAYTKWMLNSDSAFLFHRNLSVAQPVTPVSNGPMLLPVTTLQFFPEGGDMIHNLAGTVAFRAVNGAGLPVNVQGKITDREGKEIAQFMSEHDGMGKLTLTPKAGETYTAEWKDPQGNAQRTALPAVKNSGLALTVEPGISVRSFTIQRPAALEERFKRIYIVATKNEEVIFRAAVNLSTTAKVSASLPANTFPSGVIQLTLLDNQLQPVTERVLFVNNEEFHINAELVTETVDLSKRGKNSYAIELTDTVPASFSIAVTEGEGVYDSSHDIVTQLLLSSDIRGQVNDPAFYFSSVEDSVLRYLDMVMLTHGWRRFVWKDVLTASAPKLRYERDSTYLSLSGKIENVSDGKLKRAEMMNMILIAKDSSRQYIFSPIKPDGTFKEDNLILFDTTKVYYKLNNVAISARSRVSIANTFLPVDTLSRAPSLRNYLPDTTGMAHIKSIADEQRRIDSLRKGTTLQDVVVKTKVKTRMEELNERYATGIFQLGNSHDFNLVDDPLGSAYNSPIDYLKGKVAGLTVIDTNGQPAVSRRGSSVAFFINEVPTDIENITSLTMPDIAYIKVIGPPFMGAKLGGPGGAISIYTKRGGDEKTSSLGMDYSLFPGYTKVRQFYSPDYGEKQQHFSQTDLRRTIYWRPDMQSDGSVKKIVFSFYNNDISRSLRVVIEGMSTEGKLLHISRLLQ